MTQIFFGLKIFFDLKFLGPKIFQEPKILWTQNFLDTYLFGHKIILNPKLPHSAPSWILSLAENLGSFSLQDGARIGTLIIYLNNFAFQRQEIKKIKTV